MKDKVPSQLLAECISNQEINFRLEIESKGCPVEKNFEDIIRMMKSNTFDMVVNILLHF